jgi:hypothetical protein
MLTGDGGVATRRHTGGSERRRLELIAGAKEGVKELGRVGMRLRGAMRASGRGGRGRGGNHGVNGFNAIEDGGEVKRGIKGGGGMMVGRVTAQAASEGGARRHKVAGGHEEKW